MDAELDVDNCFRRMKIPAELSAYFCFPVLRAGGAGVASAGGHVLGARDWVFPAPAMLPMGFSWSLFFAHEITAALVRQTPLLASAQLLSLQATVRDLVETTPLSMFV